MEQTEITRNIVELREFEAGTREQIHTNFNRLDKQDALIESMRELFQLPPSHEGELSANPTMSRGTHFNSRPRMRANKVQNIHTARCFDISTPALA